MVEAGLIRASDADRDGVLERLRGAHVEGRLDAEELTDRAGTALAARTVGELAALTADLPPAGFPPPVPATPPAVATGPGWAVASAGGHRANHAGMVLVTAICFTVGVTVLTRGHLFIWPGWLAFWVALHLLRRGHIRGCVRAPSRPARSPLTRRGVRARSVPGGE